MHTEICLLHFLKTNETFFLFLFPLIFRTDNGFAIRIRQCILAWIDDHTVLFLSSLLYSPDSRVDNHENLFYVILISLRRSCGYGYGCICYGPSPTTMRCMHARWYHRLLWCAVYKSNMFRALQAYEQTLRARKTNAFFFLLRLQSTIAFDCFVRLKINTENYSLRKTWFEMIFSIIHISFSFSSFTEWQEILLPIVVLLLLLLLEKSEHDNISCMRIPLRRHNFYLLILPFLLIATIIVE